MELNPSIALAIAISTVALNVGSMQLPRQTSADGGLPSFEETTPPGASLGMDTEHSEGRLPLLEKTTPRTARLPSRLPSFEEPAARTAAVGAIAEPSTEPSTGMPTPEAPSSRRHRITCNVTTLDDVKVTEKQTVVAGQVLCDRTEARAALEAKKQQLELTLSQQPIAVPVTPLMQLPPADFSVEETQVAAAEAELARLESSPSPQFMHRDPWFQEVAEPERWQQQLDQQQQIANARYRVGETMAALNAAKAQRQQEELTFLQQQQLNQQQLLLEQQRAGQQQSYQKAQLLNDLQDIEEKIELITAIKSPYRGSIRRVKILGQSDRNIQVEISLIAE